MACETDHLPSYGEAETRILADLPQVATENVALAHALGRILRKPVTSDRDQPPFDQSAMDGYAVRAGEIAGGTALPIRGSIPAGAPRAAFEATMPSGAVMKIATGAPLPQGADAVVPVERTTPSRDGKTVTFHIAAKSGDNVHRRGSDARLGQVVLRDGVRLHAAGLGIAATVGAETLSVSRRPRVTILTTGDEVVPPTTPTDNLEPQQIRNSNGPLLASLLAAFGAEVLAHHHIPDEPEATEAAAAQALETSDLIVTAGGVSVGERDHLPGAWARLGARTLVHGVAIQPGKPVLVARCRDAVILGLPGNPVSSLVTAHLFAWLVVRATTGEVDTDGVARLPWQITVLAEPGRGKRDRELFRACRFTADGRAALLPWHGSGDLMHTAEAQGLVRLPRTDAILPPGSVVPVLRLCGV